MNSVLNQLGKFVDPSVMASRIHHLVDVKIVLIPTEWRVVEVISQ